jgi:hypothetical protein
MITCARLRRFCILVSFYGGLIGCAGPVSDPAGKHLHAEWVAEFGKAGMPYDGIRPGDDAVRNAFIFRMKAVKDFEYANYVINLRQRTSWGEFGSDAAKIVLDSLVALTGNAATKAALGAASAGVTGASASVKKNILFDQSITTFITKMDAQRLEKYNEILEKMKRSGYTAAEAFDDLQEYGRRGTLEVALADIDAKAGAQKDKAKAVNDKLKKIRSIDDILNNNPTE